MPQALPPHLRPAGDPLALRRPKKPTPTPPKPDEEMYDFNTPKKKEKKKKKTKNRRALLQVNRTMTDREWADISRSVGKVRSRPFSSAHFGRARIGGGYQARKKLQRNRAIYPVGSRFWSR